MSSQRTLRVLFVCSNMAAFVRNDLKLLQKHFNLRCLNVTLFLVPHRGEYLRAYLRLLKGVLWADVVYAWWADLNSCFTVLFSMLLRKKSVIVVGGYEAAYVPEINYGTLLAPVGRLQVKFILRHANKILAVSKSSKNSILRFAMPKQLNLVYNGIDTQRFFPSGKKENSVITVVRTVSPFTVDLKRLDTFLKASVYLPDVKFVLVGKISDALKDSLKNLGSSNIEFTGHLDSNELIAHYQKAKVYCQLSTHESFGVALAEAMACGCVPVVTRNYALPEIVGETGFYVPYNDAEATADAIKQALTSNKGLKARERIETIFSFKNREKRLINEILDCTK